MSEEYGSDFITIVDDDGAEFELEVLDTMDYKGQTFTAFLPANMDEEDPDYGIIILRSVFDENGTLCMRAAGTFFMVRNFKENPED